MMSKFLSFAAGLVLISQSAALSSRSHVEEMFFDHMKKYDLKFDDSKEFLHRLNIFANMVKTIEEHNALGKTWTMGLNQFSHLTTDEWRAAVHLNLKRPSLRSNNPVHGEPTTTVGVPPASWDWSAQGAVTAVKNQGQCGDCWTFSTTGALEGRFFINGNPLTSFSEQELTACDTTDDGCSGGWMGNAFTWVQNNGGIATESSYPFASAGGTSPACQGTGNSVSGSAPNGFTDVQSGSVSALQSAVYQQPVSIAIEADQSAFQSYSGGVLTGSCGQNLDHGVLAVGYGSLNGVAYWKVKNSWGPTWGLNGYILIEASSANLCGVLSSPLYPNF